MGIKKNITYFLLSVYSIVLIHNFIPHEHHSSFLECGSSCSTHTEIVDNDNCTTFHSHKHKTHKHLHCHFDVKPVLSKFIDISAYYFIEIIQEVIVNEPRGIKINSFCLLDKISEFQCRDVSLRAPPKFS